MAVASQQKRYDSYGWLDVDSTKLDRIIYM
jgi:hypothetical protein